MRALVREMRNYAGILPAAVLIGVFMVIPLMIVLVYSFLTPGDYGGVRPEFSLGAYVKMAYQPDLFDNMIFDPAYLIIAARSVIIALVTVIGCLILGFPVAYYIAHQPEARRNGLLLLITIPFWTNLLVRTYCWILVLRDTGLINGALMGLGIISQPLTLLNTNGAVALGLIYTYVPFMIMPIYAALERFDPRLIEAARDLYADRWETLRRVTLPIAMPGLVAGAILVFIPAIGAFLAPDMLGGGSRLMLGSLVQLQFASGHNWPFGSALAMVIMAAVLVSLLLFARYQRRHGGEIRH